MDLIEIIVFLIVAWGIIQIGLGICDAIDIVHLTHRVDVIRRVTELLHDVKIEIHDDIEYWYDEGNYQFLAQGKNFNEIVEVLKHRFPDHVFLLNEKGGLCALTDWKLLTPEEFYKQEITKKIL
jgi:hypothetical protein